MTLYDEKFKSVSKCFNWDEGEGFRLIQNDESWQLKVPPKYLQRITSSTSECLKNNGVNVVILKRRPFMDNMLIKKFKDIINKKKSCK